MPLQNRATPFGDIVVSPARGSLMGNRGCLHDAHRALSRRRWTTRTWVACLLSFGGRRRELMRPGHYTELFFLDEATALAAGHRPCAECRRAAFRQFVDAWATGAGRAGERVRAADMDRAIHAERITRTRIDEARIDGARDKITFDAPLADLPDGVMATTGGVALLKWNGAARPWSLEGYGLPADLSPAQTVTVLTPRPIVEAIRAGYRPEVHQSAVSA
jgi:hypothetical protein